MKKLKKSEVKKILVISLSNIGDVVLTFPVIDVLKSDFPHTQLSLVVGPKVRSLVEGNPHFHEIYFYDKHQSPIKTLSWLYQLRRKDFDLVVDLKNSAIPAFVAGKSRTSFVMRKDRDVHMKDKHLKHLKTAYPFFQQFRSRYCLAVSEAEKSELNDLVQDWDMTHERFIVMAPGSANPHKRWTQEGFAQTADYFFREHRLKTIFVGDKEDYTIASDIAVRMNHPVVNLCGMTSLAQTAEIVRRSLFSVVNDSAVLHLASYLDKPVAALFGQASDPQKYGSWSSCQRCYYHPEDISKISPVEVIHSIDISGNDVSFL